MMNEPKPLRAYQVASWERNSPPDTPQYQEAAERVRQNPDDGEAWLQKGHALAKAGHYREASECYARAIAIDPFNWEYYRYRAHRFLSCWRFEDAVADFSLAARLNPQEWNVLYHLGLAHFLLGQYDKAARAYAACYERSEDDGSLIAVTDWYWMTLKRLGRDEEAAKLLERIHTEMEPEDNTAYYARLLMYKGLKKPEELLGDDAEALELITMGFGVSNYYELLGDRRKSDEIIERVLQAGDENDMFGAFAYLAAKVDKRNRAKS